MNESMQAEKSLIGSILSDSTCISKVYNVLLPEHFGNQTLGRIYKSMLNLYNNNKNIDIATIVPELEWAGPEIDLVQIISSCCRSGLSYQIDDYAEIIMNRYRLEQAKDILNGMNYVSAKDINDQIGQTINRLTDLIKDNKSNTKSILQIYEENKERYFNPDYVRNYLYLGFSKLDQLLDGIEDTDFFVLAARPSVGKSALAYQMVLNLVKNGKRVMFYTLEMSESQLLDRMIAFESGIPMDRVKNGKSFLNDEERRFESAKEVIESVDSKLLINATGTKTPGQIRNECKFVDDLSLIVIDYLQLITPEMNRGGNRTREIGDISRALKSMAQEFHVPVLALSQLNREVEKRPDKEPNMSDLRESGDIEQDCNEIIMMWNTDSENSSKKGVKVEKNRQGVLGKVGMNFNGAQMRFTETDFIQDKPKHNDGFLTAERTPFDD